MLPQSGCGLQEVHRAPSAKALLDKALEMGIREIFQKCLSAPGNGQRDSHLQNQTFKGP